MKHSTRKRTRQSHRTKKQYFELQKANSISISERVDLPKVSKYSSIQLLPTKKEDYQAKRRFLVPRTRWKDLPAWVWYIAVRHPGASNLGDRVSAPLLLEYARERPWKNCVELPRLSKDPLFCDPDQPALLRFRPRKLKEKVSGAVIVCPGGNYEFLSPQEGCPVASWFAQQGLPSYVLRYRLLPTYGVNHALEDLRNAVLQVRQEQQGPVCIIGFSASAHLCATFCSAGLGKPFRKGTGLGAGTKQLVQVLCYPCFDASEFVDPEKAGWWWGHSKEILALGRGEELGKFDLVNARPVADTLPVAPTLVVHSTEDAVCSVSAHSDRYVKRFRGAIGRQQDNSSPLHSAPLSYIRGAFGDHGCGVTPSWSAQCLDWLRQHRFHF